MATILVQKDKSVILVWLCWAVALCSLVLMLHADLLVSLHSSHFSTFFSDLGSGVSLKSFSLYYKIKLCGHIWILQTGGAFFKKTLYVLMFFRRGFPTNPYQLNFLLWLWASKIQLQHYCAVSSLNIASKPREMMPCVRLDLLYQPYSGTAAVTLL